MTPDVIGPGELKVVSAWSPARDVSGEVEEVLRANVRPEDIRKLWDATFLVYTEASQAEIRDWLAGRLSEGDGVFVAAFERWSSWGRASDHRAWLLRRGH